MNTPSKSRITDRHFKMNISQARILKRWKEYFIITFDTNNIFRGRFDNWDDREDILEEMYYTYSKIPCRKYKNCRYIYNHYFTCNNNKYKFTEFDYYYNVKEFKCELKRRAEKARQQMEHRAVNMILKRLVNEEFEW
jgi:hypothetical protein